MRDNRFECGCERGRRCDTISYCQVQDMADEYEDRIAELEATLQDLGDVLVAAAKAWVEAS